MHKLISLMAIVAGILAVLVGLILGLSLIAFSAFEAAGQTQGIITGVSLLLLSAGFGSLAAWAGWRAYGGQPARALRLPDWGWLALAFIACLVIGQLALDAGLTLLFPFFHVAAGVLPALILLSLMLRVSRIYDGAVSRRSSAGSLAWGALAGPALAGVLEAIFLLLFLVMAIVWLQVSDPASLEQLQDWAIRYLTPNAPLTDLTDLGPLARIILSPAVVLAALVMVGVITPIVEEGIKALAVPLVALGGHKLTPFQGFMLGATSGAGFAILEGSLYGTVGLAVPGTWVGLMLVRGGTAAIHCLASGLAGLGWQTTLSERRWLRGLVLGLLAAALHGVWNAAAAIQAFLALRYTLVGGLEGSFDFRPASLPGSLALLAIVFFMGLLWLASVAALPLLARYLARTGVQVLPVPAEVNSIRSEAEDQP